MNNNKSYFYDRTVIENFIAHFNNALEISDYDQAINILDQYYVAAYRDLEKNINKISGEKYIILFSTLFETLLKLSDEHFYIPCFSYMEQVEDWFRDEISKCKIMLETANEDAAMEVSKRLNNLLQEKQIRLKELEEKERDDLKEFILFWRLWKLLDAIIKQEDFPRDRYDFFAASLYGAIMPAFQNKESIMFFSKHYDEIFEVNPPREWLKEIISDD